MKKEKLLDTYGYQKYIDGVIDYTNDFISNKLCMTHVKKWKQFYECKSHMVLDYIGNMPYGVVGSENKNTYFAPKLSLFDLFYIAIYGWEAEEQNIYTGAMMSYSIKRTTGINEKVIKFLVKSKYINLVQKSVEKRRNKRFQINYFADCPFVKGKRIVVYGAGKIGSHMVKKILEQKEEKLVLWIDQNEDKKNSCFPIAKPEAILNVEFDYVILASVCREYLNSMFNRMRQINIPEEKIIYYKN